MARDYVSQTGVGGVPNPNELQPKSDQFSLSVERELRANFAARVTLLYSNNRNNYRQLNVLRPYEAYNIPVTRPDPGPDGVAGNGDDPGQSITYYEYSPALAGQRFQLVTWETDPDGQPDLQEHRDGDVPALHQRLAVLGVADGHAGSTCRWSMGWCRATATPPCGPLKSRRTPRSSRTDDTWERTAKASATYQLPWFGLLTSANFEHRQGSPWARQVRFTGGVTIPQIVLNVEPIGTRRMDDINLLDLRVQKRSRCHERNKIVLRLNVFNALNTNAVTGLTQRAGPAFLRPTSIIPPRILELSTSFSF